MPNRVELRWMMQQRTAPCLTGHLNCSHVMSELSIKAWIYGYNENISLSFKLHVLISVARMFVVCTLLFSLPFR